MPSTAAVRTLALSAMALSLAACGSSPPGEEDVKSAFRQWHEQTYDVDGPQEFQSVIGTSSIVDWPNCTLVNAFDLGGKWMTLTMEGDQIVEVVAGHHAGRSEYASERGCE